MLSGTGYFVYLMKQGKLHEVNLLNNVYDQWENSLLAHGICLQRLDRSSVLLGEHEWTKGQMQQLFQITPDLKETTGLKRPQSLQDCKKITLMNSSTFSELGLRDYVHCKLGVWSSKGGDVYQAGWVHWKTLLSNSICRNQGFWSWTHTRD